MMWYRVAVVTACGLVFFTAAHAENPFKYDVETTLSYGRIGGMLTAFEVDVARYFETVNTQSRPSAEAAFLQHASNVEVAVYSVSIDLENYAGNELGFDVGLHYVLDALPLVISGKAGWAARALDNSDANLNTSEFGIGAGAYVTQGTYLGAEFSQTDRALSYGSGSGETASFTTTGINAKSVFEISDDFSVGVKARRAQKKFEHDAGSDFNRLDLGLDVYVQGTASIGIYTEDTHRSGGSDLRTRSIALRWFFIPEVSVMFEFGRLTDNDPVFSTPQKHQLYALSLSARM